MKCPYCAEEIKDEAVACSHCGREFMLLKPILDKISALERQVSGVSASAGTQPLSVASQREDHEDSTHDEATEKPIRKPRIFLAVLLAVCVPVLCNELVLGILDSVRVQDCLPAVSPLLWAPYRLLASLAEFGAFYAPALFGFWMAFRWSGLHAGMYVLLGFAVGILELPLEVAINLFYWDFPAESINWPWSLTVWFVIPAMLFIAGALFADFVEMRKTPHKAEGSLAAKAVSRATSGKNVEPSQQLTQTVQLIKTLIPLVITAFAPSLFKFIAFLVTGTWPA